MGDEMDLDDYEPTIEDEIRWNNELNPTEKKLLIHKSRIETYRAIFLIVPFLLVLGFVGVLVRGWLGTVLVVVLFWGGAITYTILEEKKKTVEAALREEYENQRKMKSRRKKRG